MTTARCARCAAGRGCVVLTPDASPCVLVFVQAVVSAFGDRDVALREASSSWVLKETTSVRAKRKAQHVSSGAGDDAEAATP